MRLEAARFDGERQQQALDRLIAAAAARERQVADQLRRLEELAATPTVEGAKPAEEEEAKKRAFGITFEKADTVDDPDS